jgi:hypothetical protein
MMFPREFYDGREIINMGKRMWIGLAIALALGWAPVISMAAPGAAQRAGSATPGAAARSATRPTTSTLRPSAGATATSATRGAAAARGARPRGNPLPYHPTASFLNPGFPDREAGLNFMCDQLDPRNSRDTSHMDLWPHLGTAEWVEYHFEAPRKVSGVSVYWFDDRGSGACRVPASWKLLYRDGQTWKPVEAQGTYGVELDQFNLVGIKAVTTDALRLELQCQPEVSAGILEWRVE